MEYRIQMKADQKEKKRKPREYIEGPKAKKNFEDLMKGLFRVPKSDSKKGKS